MFASMATLYVLKYVFVVCAKSIIHHRISDGDIR